jgi:hypothetical protein
MITSLNSDPLMILRKERLKLIIYIESFLFLKKMKEKRKGILKDENIDSLIKLEEMKND